MNLLRLFLSHTSTDKSFADTLVHALREAGADVWYDEHHLGTSQLFDEITRELAARPVFVVLLSKDAFASTQVQRECRWAYTIYTREPGRVILPVLAGPIAPGDFNALLSLKDFTRVEAPGYQPYPTSEAIERTLRALTVPPEGTAPAPTPPEAGETAEQLLTQGKVLLGKKQFAEATPFLERATRLEPQNAEAWATLGWSYNEVKRRGEALAASERALALNPDDARAWNNTGNALWALQRYEEALAAFEHALALDPGLAAAWNGKGNAFYGLKRPEEALAAYERALTLNPASALYSENRALALKALGRS